MCGISGVVKRHVFRSVLLQNSYSMLESHLIMPAHERHMVGLGRRIESWSSSILIPPFWKDVPAEYSTSDSK